MFTGLVEATGAVVDVRKDGGELDLDVRLGGVAESARIGDSIALSGVCCTVVRLDGDVATFHLSPETLRRTWLGEVGAGAALNLERALRAGDPLGGHLVQGHVDGVGEVAGAIDPEAGGELWVRIPDTLRRYCVEKGSITIDGVSLTIAALDGDRIMIAVIPHTAAVTTLGRAEVGRAVHLEVDVIAKYVEQMLAARFGDGPPAWQPPSA